jgi:hypothetical protein
MLEGPGPRRNRGHRAVTTEEKRREWAIVDSNHGPPPYQSGALTD